MNRNFYASLLLFALLPGVCWLAGPECLAQESDNPQIRGYESYVNGLMKNYDKDKDDKLSASEIERMRRKPGKKVDENGDGAVSRVELVNSYLKKAGLPTIREKDSKELDDKSQDSLTVNVFMLCSTDDSAMTELAKKLEGESFESVNKTLEGIQRDEELVGDVDHALLSAAWNQKLDLTMMSQEPVVTRVSKSSTGAILKKVDEVDVGTVMSVFASSKKGNQILRVNLSKSTIFPSKKVLHESATGEKTYAQKVATVDLKTEFPFKNDEANVCSMSNFGSTWLFVILAQ